MAVERVCDEFGPAPVKFFTVDEARLMLPLVKSIARDMTEQCRELHRLNERLAALKELPSEDEAEQIEQDVQARVEKVEGCLKELTELGIHPKDPRRGLMDWPTLVDDKPAYICWEYGEEGIDYWHDLVHGFAGRRPVEELLVSSE